MDNSGISPEIMQNALLKKKVEEGLSNRKIAEEANVAQNFVQRLLAGQSTRPNKHNEIRMAEYLGLNETKPYIHPIAEESIELIKTASNLMNADLLELMQKHIEYCVSFVTGGELLIKSARPPRDKLTDMFPDSNWAFGLRALHDEIVTKLPHIPSFRLSIRRDKPLNAYKGYSDVECEIYAKGVESFDENGELGIMGSAESVLVREIIKEFPSGGVFNYAHEIENRNINDQVNNNHPVAALLIIVALPYGQRVYVRLDNEASKYTYTHRDHQVLYSTVQKYLNDQGYMLTPNNNQYYGGLNGA